MTPKDKAIELVDKFKEANSYTHYARENAKDFALICVNELIKYSPIQSWKYTAFGSAENFNEIYSREHWQEVKQEIELL